MTILREVMEQPIAHRGLHDVANGIIENSASAFANAIENGCAIECDINLSGDEIPMVIHDLSIDRVTGQRGMVSKISAGQLGRIKLKGSSRHDKILRFAQLLELVDGKVTLVIELKSQEDNRDESLTREAVRIVKDYDGPLTFISYNPGILAMTKAFGFTGPTGIVVKRFVDERSQKQFSASKRFILRHLLHYPKSCFDFINCNHKALDLPAIRLFHALGMPLATWTLKSQIEAEAALKHCDQVVFEGYIPRRD